MTIYIRKEVLKSIQYIGRTQGNMECGGFLRIIKKNNDLHIIDYNLPKQECQGATYDITPEDNIQWIAQEENPEEWCGWWHSHSKMQVFWSGTDDEEFGRMSKNTGFALGIVINNKGDVLIRVDFNSQYGSSTANDVQAEILEQKGWRVNKKEINKLIEERITNKKWEKISTGKEYFGWDYGAKYWSSKRKNREIDYFGATEEFGKKLEEEWKQYRKWYKETEEHFRKHKIEYPSVKSFQCEEDFYLYWRLRNNKIAKEIEKEARIEEDWRDEIWDVS